MLYMQSIHLRKRSGWCFCFIYLQLEENIRAVAVSGDWYKLVDDWSDESSVTQSATIAAGSSQKRGPSRRRGRKRFAAISEVTSDDCLDDSSDVNWWRGGMLSKLILQKGLLPCSLVKKAARQGNVAAQGTKFHFVSIETAETSLVS